MDHALMKYSNRRFASVSARISTRLGRRFFRSLAFGVEVRPDCRRSGAADRPVYSPDLGAASGLNSITATNKVLVIFILYPEKMM